MTMEERTGSAEGYRFGFQGQETDDEVYGGENAVSFKYRVHDARIGRFLSIDPLAPEYPWNSPYAFSENKVIQFIELEGLETAPSAAQGMTQGLLYGQPPTANTTPTPSDRTENKGFLGWFGLDWLSVPETPQQNSTPVIRQVRSETITLSVTAGTCQNEFICQDRITRIEHGDRTQNPEAIVLHRTAGSTVEGTINWWKDEDAPTLGTTFIIAKDGRVIQTTLLHKKTYHTIPGTVEVDGTTRSVNNSNSIGIEVVGTYSETEGWESLTAEQIHAINDLVVRLQNYYNLEEGDLFFHYQVDPVNKKEGEGEQAVDAARGQN